MSTARDAKTIERSNEYLRRYGYFEDMPLARDKAMHLADSVTETALKRFQQFHGLKESGELDDETLEAMASPRCGVPDLLRFTTFTTKWDHRLITFAIQNAPANLTLQDVRNAINTAFDIWTQHCPLEFAEVPATQPHDIDIQFAAGNHGDGFPFDGGGTPAGNVLAHAFAPPPNGTWAGDVHFDNAETFSVVLPVPTNSIDLIQVAAHEIGHALGLDHSSVNTALMRPLYHNPTKRNLDADDIAGIQSLYGTGYILQTRSALRETGDSWDFGLASNQDVFGVQRQGTSATELHIIQATNGYQSFSLQTPTALHRTDGNWSFAVAANRDLFAINRRGTQSTEVHVLSAASNYQRFTLQVRTGLHQTDSDYAFLLAPNRDLFVIKRRGTTATEVHILSASSSYSQFTLQASTGLHQTDQTFDFAILANRDIAAISKQARGRTEVHILSSDSSYRRFALQTRTVLHATDSAYCFAMTPRSDLFTIKKRGTGSSSTEFHIVDLR